MSKWEIGIAIFFVVLFAIAVYLSGDMDTGNAVSYSMTTSQIWQ